MDQSPLNNHLRAFCENLSRNDSDGSGERDALLAALQLYVQLPPAKMLTHMIEAQSRLFGGRIETVWNSLERVMPDADDSEKSHFLASAMRDHIKEAEVSPATDVVLNLIYKTTALFEENTDHVWECLLTAATYYAREMIAPENAPRNFSRQVIMHEFNREEERDLYGDFDPTPVSTPDRRTEDPVPPQHPPKFLH